MKQGHVPWAEAKVFLLLLFARYEQQSFVFVCFCFVFYCAWTVYWLLLVFSGIWRISTSSVCSPGLKATTDPSILLHFLPSRCVLCESERKEKRKTHTHCTHTHSVVWYLLSPLLTAAHKKFTESPPFCFHQHITLSSYYANEITAL